jgi:Outer membrane lipoprotein-sorting protein
MKSLFWLLVLVFSFSSHSIRAADEALSAEQVLELVRRSYALQEHKMTGRLRDAESGREEPLELSLSGKVMRFRFTSGAPEIIHLDLNTSPATLWQVKPGGTTQVPLKNAADPVRGMDLSYEDLSLRFLYWPTVKMLDANARFGPTRERCWLVRVTAPDTKAPYYTVDLWVHRDSGGVARMIGYNKLSKMVKRFEVKKVQKVDGVTVLKEMKIESFNALDESPKGKTYLTLDKPEKQP